MLSARGIISVLLTLGLSMSGFSKNAVSQTWQKVTPSASGGGGGANYEVNIFLNSCPAGWTELERVGSGAMNGIVINGQVFGAQCNGYDDESTLYTDGGYILNIIGNYNCNDDTVLCARTITIN